MPIKKMLFFLLLMIVTAFAYGQVTPAGDSLQHFYLSLNVENRWIAGNHVQWETGEADHPDATSGNHTHCSAFVAAACKRLDLYILRPPEHKQVLLANAQCDWIGGAEAIADGWKPVTGNNIFAAAQRLANNGTVVVVLCRNPDDRKPGHAALVLPAEISAAKLALDGPFVIQAGTHNHNKISLKAGFSSHLVDWPASNILFYYNTRSLHFPS